MAAAEVVLLIELCEIGRGMIGCEVCFQVGVVVVGRKRSTNYLFYGACVEINAGTETRHVLLLIVCVRVLERRVGEVEACKACQDF